MNLSYANEDEIFLGLELDNPVSLKLPKAWAVRGSGGPGCSGWQLAEEDVDGNLELVDWEMAEGG